MATSKIQTSAVANSITDLISAIGATKAVKQEDAVKRGYYSSHEAAKAMGLNISTTQRKLKAACDAGIIEKIRVSLNVGGIAYYYRPRKKGAK